MIRALVSLLLLLTVQCVSAASAREEVEFDHSPDALRRGAAIVTGVCMSCHSLKYLRYLDLKKLGFSDAEVEAMSAGNPPAATLNAMTPPDVAEQTYGRTPPDLSLMAKAREGGPGYIYHLLTGFYQDANGEAYNLLYPGTRMPDILGRGSADATQRAELEKQAKDAASFLTWAADPRADERTRLGYYVISYLVVLTVLLFLVKRRVWRRLRLAGCEWPFQLGLIK